MDVNKDDSWIKQILCDLIVEVGRTTCQIADIQQNWHKGHVIKLDDSIVNTLNIYINDKKAGEGNIIRKPDGEMCLHINSFLSKSEVLNNVSENINMQ